MVRLGLVYAGKEGVSCTILGLYWYNFIGACKTSVGFGLIRRSQIRQSCGEVTYINVANIYNIVHFSVNVLFPRSFDNLPWAINNGCPICCFSVSLCMNFTVESTDIRGTFDYGMRSHVYRMINNPPCGGRLPRCYDLSRLVNPSPCVLFPATNTCSTQRTAIMRSPTKLRNAMECVGMFSCV